jgi:hypothetical protein
MHDRRMWACLGLLAAGLIAFAGRISHADEPTHHGNNPHMQHCARACADCMRACESCARHCAELVAAGQKDHLTTLGTCADCGDICGTSAKLCAREGPLAVKLCAACAKACATCGAACEKFPDDKHMAECAKVCRDCEKVCEEMIGVDGRGEK